jgi:hypothetical protein
MSIRRAIGLAALAALVAAAASADVRELSGAELRESVATGQSRPLGPIVEMVGRQVEGEFIDARAYESDGIYYRILLRTPDGKLASVIVDARTGGFVSARSGIAQEIVAAARSQTILSIFYTSGGGNSGGGNGNSGNNGNGAGKK